MKRGNFVLLAFFACGYIFIQGPTFADEGANGSKIESKAIEAAEMQKGFRLRERAAQALGIQFGPVSGDSIIVGPMSVVRFQDFTAVYRRRDGWIKMVEIEGVRESDGRLRFSSKDFASGDEIALQGASELRVIDMDLWGPKAYACGD